MVDGGIMVGAGAANASCWGPPMQARRLILTADDFGRSPEINAAIARWFRAGALTHASLMVNEPHAAEAVALARELTGLQVGLHLTLCGGLASDGRQMPRSPTWAGLRLAFSPGARAWARREIAAQFSRFRDLGLPSTYWDGHTHLHLHPVVFRLTLPIARERGFGFTRVVREPGPWALVPWIFERLSRRAVPALRAAKIGFADRVFGLRQSGRMDPPELERALALSAEGTTEIYFHPGAEDRIAEGDVARTVAEWRRVPGAGASRVC
jgi:predicted glycoside hydrolase/deacetylase ChbG (UPF0249 family)